MNIKITFKDPDAPHNAVTDAVAAQVAAMPDMDDDEREQLEESRREKAMELLKPWLSHGEYITIEFDTDAKTAVVLPARP